MQRFADSSASGWSITRAEEGDRSGSVKPTSVGVRELKNRLSHYLRKVKAGQTVVVTEHGRAIGQIVPIRADIANRMKALANAGVIEWNDESPPAYKPKAVNRGKRTLSDLVIEDRE